VFELSTENIMFERHSNWQNLPHESFSARFPLGKFLLAILANGGR